MSGWESLYSTASGDYSSGNYKDSYTNYLKAARALLDKLNNEVDFANKDTLRKKPHNTAYLFTQLKSCVQRLEDILQNRATNGNLSSPQPSYISDLATSIITVNPTPQHLPLIPFSPLTRHSIHYAHQLATANQKVSIIKQKNLDNSNKDYIAVLRKLDEEIRQYRTKLDQVNNQIQSISEDTLLRWNADEVSKQLTIIDGELYKRVDFKKDLTLKDKRASKAQACMDFHRYLTNSFTHQFMIYADTTRSSGNPPRRENIIAHAIRIAYYLLHVHRNFNSFAALMKALTSPEVRRIRRLWVNLPPRTNQYFKEFSSYVKKEDNDYKAYTEILSQKIEYFREVDQIMVVIPWMQPHYEEIKAITQSYTSGKSGDNTGVILSAPGQRKLASIFSLLEQCQSNVINTDDDEWRSNNFNGRKVPSSHSHKIQIDGTSINLPLDLSCMGNGNMELHHWLVSRVYLTKQQLIDESMEIEPLAENEQPLCVENEYEEEGEESDHNSVGRYEIGSEDGGDNIELSNYDVTNGSGSRSNQPSPNKLGELSNSSLFVSSKTSLMSKHERSESGSKSIVNGTSSFMSYEFSKSEESEVMENDSVGTNSLITPSNVANSTAETTTISSFTSGSKTKAIPIPQSAGQKSHQPSISPASMLTNLNPNAQPFVPSYILSSSAPGPTSGINNNVPVKDFAEMVGKNKTINHTTTNTTEEDDDERFVYPVGKSDKEEDDDTFVYQTPTEATSSNGLKKDDEDDDDDDDDDDSEDSNKEEKFTYPDAKNLQDEQDDNDDGEGSSFVYPTNDNNASSDHNSNININGIITKIDKSSENENEITVKISV